MGNHHLPLSAHLIVLLAAASSAAEAPPSGVVPDVVIQAEDRRPVAREKPPIDLPLKLDQPLQEDVDSDDGVRARLPSDLSQTTAFAPGLSQSPLSASPSSNWIVAASRGESVRVMFPRRELQAVEAKFSKDGKWDLVVADSQGKAFRKYSGEGAPPEQLEFDGRGDGGEWLAVGHAYTPVLTYHDGVRARTAMGRPFALAGLSLDAPRAIWLAPRALFGSGAGPELSAEGKAILREAAQLVQRHYPGIDLELTLRLVRSDPVFLKSAGELCVKELARNLLIKPEAVSLKLAPGTPDLQERVELAAVSR
ncbi:MAG: hypothetical protein HY403_01845 [Elusimicrobia bacterium]|nr:hypothetical protein [Elusimicrobiota bacterium]